MKRSFCVRQIQTDLYDGWYEPTAYQPREMLQYWKQLLPQYDYEIVFWPNGPEELSNSKMLNNSAAYLASLEQLPAKTPLKQRVFSMKKWVRLHKDGDHMGVETNCTDEREFWIELSDSLAKAIEGKYLGQAQEQFQRWLPQAFECLAQLRGYKANVVIEQIVKAGEVYSGTQEVFSSERPNLSIVSKEEVG